MRRGTQATRAAAVGGVILGGLFGLGCQASKAPVNADLEVRQERLLSFCQRKAQWADRGARHRAEADLHVLIEAYRDDPDKQYRRDVDLDYTFTARSLLEDLRVSAGSKCPAVGRRLMREHL
jgi:hypothetical protein